MDYESLHKERLLRHARDYVAAIGEHDAIIGIIVGGSPAHGGVDRESDVDMLLIVEKLPTPDLRADWLGRIVARDVTAADLPPTEDRKWDEFHVPGPKIDPEQWGEGGVGGGLFYFTQAEVERDLNRVAELLVAFIGRDELERPSHFEEYLADLAHGIILHDPRGLLARWQEMLSRYPESARERLINYHWKRAEIAINEDLQRAVWRSDFLHAYDRRVEGVRHLVRMMFAMNRRYFRKGKGLERLLGTFEKCPQNTWERLLKALREPDHMRAAAMLLALAGDVIDLVERPDLLEGRQHWRNLCAEWAREYEVS